MEYITLQNNWLTVEISPFGAEVQRVCDANGIERLWDGDPAFWTGRSPVLFPLAGALLHDTYTLNGTTYTLGKHGFAKVSLFAVEESGPESATFLLTSNEASSPGFPFAYEFRVRYTLEGATLRTEYITDNKDHQAFYFGTGAHEAYACPEGIEAYEIVFEAKEPLAHSLLDGSLLNGETTPIPLVDGHILPLSDSLFTNDSLVLRGHTSRSCILRSKLHSRQVRIDFADFDYLLVWTMKGAGYICIEPWSNLPDFVDTDQDISKKPGMARLAPGERRVFAHTVAFS